MLNRTNRTLSANLLRLNLGTRSLAIAANVNNGAQTLRTRHVHRVVMRDGMPGYAPALIPIGRGAIPEIPGSPAVPSWLSPSRSVWTGVELGAALFPTVDRPCRPGESFDCSSERGRLLPEHAKTDRKSFTGKRFQRESDQGQTVAQAALVTQADLLPALGG
jgi:hypothetical protein